MARTHRIAGLKISRVDPIEDIPERAIAVSAAETFPDLEPPEDRLRQSKRLIFASDRISLSHGSAMEDVFEPKQRAEHSDILARATVYVMNMIVIVMSLPIGLALLAFNILGGENLRTTAHVIALTGMGAALSQTPQGVQILSMF